MITSIGLPSYEMGVLVVDTVMEYAESGITEKNKFKSVAGTFIEGETVKWKQKEGM